jgi:hypothetical protein
VNFSYISTKNETLSLLSIIRSMLYSPHMLCIIYIIHYYLFKKILVSEWLTANCEIVISTQWLTKYAFFTFIIISKMRPGGWCAPCTLLFYSVLSTLLNDLTCLTRKSSATQWFKLVGDLIKSNF